MQSVEPIITAHLFPKLDEALIKLLKSLSLEEWNRKTIVPKWTVKDIAVHLLDGNIRALSMLRDSYLGQDAPKINSYQDLVNYLNELNADWIKAMKRVSPVVLIDLLEKTGKEYSDFITTLNLEEKATFSVAWAGEEESKNWFHIAREYTEKWHHQQQIRLALGKEEVLYQREFYFPHLDTSMRALPHHYKDVEGEKNEYIHFHITGKAGGDWFLYYDGKHWILVDEIKTNPVCKVEIEYKIAWRLFTKGISKSEAQKNINIKGKKELGEKILDMLAVMA
ncbi:maleylpyruvate isomerase N-terminal domain-containing protein [Bernardetia sp.]|uniref:maleylpyruvate isomerase N-terminal domain-containing protein n=1 Tax=Bernardetia sp. TaxID=1937974 RepID=UPI0025C4CB72|nr:maleylpyruvate isomerase N-terminal domain-containing protein [Bernardetia sp.]